MKKQLKADQKPNTIRKKVEEPNRRTAAEWQFIAGQLRSTDLMSIEEFYLNLDIPKQTFYDAVKREQCMSDAHAYALEKIGIKREKICLDKNLSTGSVAASSLTQFLERYRKDVEWKAKLKEEIQAASSDIIKEVLREVLQPIEEKK